MTQLKLQKRDDPLAISTPATDQADPGETPTPAPPPRRPPAARRPATRRAKPAPTQPAAPSTATAAERTYDEDRLEQTGWRLYESLLAEVKARADELSAAGIPTSAAALAAATLHTHLPRTPEDGAEIMRTYRQASAGRQRTRRGY